MTRVGNDVVNHGAVRFRMETRAIIWRRLIMVSRAYDGGTDPGRLVWLSTFHESLGWTACQTEMHRMRVDF